MARRARLVAGIDSSTQATKVVVRHADTGALVREGRAPHPDGTEIDPAHWWQALQTATAGGLLDDVAAVAVGAQQHGMVCLDEGGQVVRPALLWNDTRSAKAATDLIGELGGAQAWAEATGSVPVASFTVTKLRWLAAHEPDHAKRTATVMLPHDWLTWRLSGGQGDPVIDPGDAALGVGARPGDVVVSIGTSGTVFAVHDTATADPSGIVAGFADATGRYLPLVCTLNAARVLEAAAACSASTSPALTTSPWPPRREPTGSSWSRTSRASAPPTAPRTMHADPTPHVRQAYAAARDRAD